MKRLIVCLILIFSVTAFAEGIDYNSLTPEELQQIIENASSVLDEKNSNTEYTHISVDDLFYSYSQNEAAADLKYTNQIVEICDNVYNIEKSGKSYKVSLGDGGLFSNSIICHMREDQLTQIAELVKGEDVIIRGKCDGDPSWGIIYFYDCEIVK